MITLTALLNILILAFAGIGIFRLLRRNWRGVRARRSDADNWWWQQPHPSKILGDRAVVPSSPYDPIDIYDTDATGDGDVNRTAP